MKRAVTGSFVLVVMLGALAGCGQATETPAAATAPATASGQSMEGMVMGAPTAAAESSTGQPTFTQALICGSEIRAQVAQVLALDGPPALHSSLVHQLYSCTYDLPAGEMRLSVQHSSTPAAALIYLQAQRRRIGANQAVLGLTDHAYATGDGVVILVKDNETLEVDTTSLPTVFGSEHQKRSDLAYEIASDVLGCWTGDNS